VYISWIRRLAVTT